MHLNFSNLRPCTRMYSIRYKSRIRVKLKYRYVGKRPKIYLNQEQKCPVWRCEQGRGQSISESNAHYIFDVLLLPCCINKVYLYETFCLKYVS